MAMTTYPTATHCCVCSGVCNHTGGPFYCSVHAPQPFGGLNRNTFYYPIPQPGWECPKCGRVYAPHVNMCWICIPKVEPED